MTVAMSATMPMTVALIIITTAVFSPSFMTAVIVPMVAVPFIVAVADDHLVMTTAVTYISCADIVVMHPRPWLIQHYFISMINVVIAPSVRQIRTAYPNPII